MVSLDKMLALIQRSSFLVNVLSTLGLVWDALYLKKNKMIKWNPETNSVITDCCPCEHPCCVPNGFVMPLELRKNQLIARKILRMSKRFPSRAIYSANQGCLGLSETGCLLTREERPVVCNIYPFYLVSLDPPRIGVHGCPAIYGSPPHQLKIVAGKILAYLGGLEEEFLLRLKLTYP
jgi:hypothetical protein